MEMVHTEETGATGHSKPLDSSDIEEHANEENEDADESADSFGGSPAPGDPHADDCLSTDEEECADLCAGTNGTTKKRKWGSQGKKPALLSKGISKPVGRRKFPNKRAMPIGVS